MLFWVVCLLWFGVGQQWTDKGRHWTEHYCQIRVWTNISPCRICEFFFMTAMHGDTLCAPLQFNKMIWDIHPVGQKVFCDLKLMSFVRKSKQDVEGSGVGVGLGISRGTEERAYGYPRGQLKKKWNFQRYRQESHVEFPLWVFWFLSWIF